MHERVLLIKENFAFMHTNMFQCKKERPNLQHTYMQACYVVECFLQRKRTANRKAAILFRCLKLWVFIHNTDHKSPIIWKTKQNMLLWIFFLNSITYHSYVAERLVQIYLQRRLLLGLKILNENVWRHLSCIYSKV